MLIATWGGWPVGKNQSESLHYSHLHEELELRLQESERVGFGFVLPKAVVDANAPNAPKNSNTKPEVEIAA